MTNAQSFRTPQKITQTIRFHFVILIAWMSSLLGCATQTERLPTTRIVHAPTQDLEAFGNELIARLVPPTRSMTLIVKQEIQPLALSKDGNTVIISTGLIKITPIECALAFIVAHEIAHHLLNHFTDTKLSDDAKEKEADKLAMKLLEVGRYDKRGALIALNYFGSEFPSVTHPATTERFEALHGFMSQVPYATYDRRVFQKLRQNITSQE